MAKKMYYVYKSVTSHIGRSWGHRMPSSESVEYFSNKKDAERKQKEYSKADTTKITTFWIDFDWESDIKE